jgi:hypothetical protein
MAIMRGNHMTSQGSANSCHRVRTNKLVLLITVFLLAGTALVFSEYMQRDMRTGLINFNSDL